MIFSHGEIKENFTQFSPELFKNPPSDYSPAYAWVWASPLNRDEIVRQVDYLYDNNIKCFYILPEPKEFRPKTMPTDLYPDYLTEEYFDIYRFTLDYAASKGMQVWLYDEGGWPSGSANHMVTAKRPHLMYAYIDKCETSSPYVPGEHAIAAFCDGARVKKGFKSEKPITEYFYTNSVYEPEYPNLCLADTTDFFIELTHEAYKRHIGNLFGSQMKMAFTDEPAVGLFEWFDGLPELFEQRYGYDIIDFLPQIMDKQPVSLDAEQARVDYFDLVAETFCKNYFLRLRAWCRENGLMSAGHLGGEDETRNCNKAGFHHVMRQLRALDVPGIDTIWRQIFPGNRNHFFPRFASSAANQIGSPYAVSESFSIYGMGLTFSQMRYVMLYQMVRGINLINIMSTSFDYAGLNRLRGGPTFMPLEPQWAHLSHYNLYTARMSYLMCLGKYASNCGLYMPMHDFWAGGKDMDKTFDDFDDTAWELEKLHCQFDIIDDDFLETAKPINGTLCCGNACYDTLVIPGCHKMPEKSRRVIDDFERAGGKVIYAPDGLEDIKPVCKISDPNVKVLKRSSESYNIYLVVNEAPNRLSFSLELPEEGNVYLLEAESGNVYPSKAKQTLALESGEGKVFMACKDRLFTLCQKLPGQLICQNDCFEMRPVYRFLMGDQNFDCETPDAPFLSCNSGDWCELLGKSFSGRVQYRMKFGLGKIPEEGIIIDLGEVNHSVQLTLNGHDLGVRCFAPYTFFAGKSILCRLNELTAEVANTPGNEFSESNIYDRYTQNQIGPYQKIVVKYEGESAPSGLMSPVKIYNAQERTT